MTNKTTQSKVEEVALENAQRAYEYAQIKGHTNPDAAAEAAYNSTIKEAAKARIRDNS